MTVSALAPLKLHPFRRLLAVDATNYVGDWIGQIALAILVFAETKSAIAVALLFFFLKAVPAVASPALVARLEQLPANRSLPALYLTEAAVFVGFALLAKSFWLPAVLGLALVDGALSLSGQTFVRSVSAALLEPSGRLRQGNALLNLVFTLGFAVGPALGGVAVAFLGLQTALLIDAATFALAALVLGVTSALPTGNPEAGKWKAHLREGFKFMRKDRGVLLLIAGYAVFVLFAAAPNPIEVVFAKETLGTGDTGYGLLIAAWGAGAAIGGLIFAARPHARLYLLVLLGGVAEGMAYLGTSQAPTLAVACGMLLAGGVGNGIQWVAVMTIIQERTAQSLQTRVIAVHNALSISLVPGLAYMLGGALTAILSTRATFAIAGAGALVVTFALIPGLLPFARGERATTALAGADRTPLS